MQTNDHISIQDGLKVFYRTSGDPEKQHLVFFNGWSARVNGLMGSDKVIEELAKHFYVVCPEVPGLMRSEPPKEVWKHQDFVSFIEKLLAPLELKNPIIVGQSFGGGIAATYVERLGGRAKTLVLIDALLTGREKNWYWYIKFFIVPLARLVNHSFFPMFIKRMVWSAYLGVPNDMLNKENITDYKVMSEFQRSEYYLPVVDYKKLEIPLILIWGNRDTWVCDVERAKAIHQEIPDSKMSILKGPHTILYQKPKYVIDEMLKLLDTSFT